MNIMKLNGITDMCDIDESSYISVISVFDKE
jgi:hypothetical protein